MAFLRHTRKQVGGVQYEYWILVESVRTQKGPRQRTIATLGKGPGLDEEERVGWEEITRQINGTPKETSQQMELFEVPEKEAEVPKWATIDLRSVRVERMRRFGDVYLGLVLWNRLRLNEFFKEKMTSGKEDVPWAIVSCLMSIARFSAPSSELAIAESWYEQTALEDLLAVSMRKINEDRLYRGLDEILPHREGVFAHLRQMYGQMFGAKFEILLYDVTSTYFEGTSANNELAQRGYSRDKRGDCPQVCLGLVVTPEGFPLAYEIFEGNRPDVSTLEDVFNLMEDKYGKAQRLWVVDRGIVSEDNLAALRRRGASYLVGTPRSKLKGYEQALMEKDWVVVQKDVEAKIVSRPPGKDTLGENDPSAQETYILCRSQGRMQKDRAIVEKMSDRLEKELLRIEKQIHTGRLTNRIRAERQVGRLFERYSRAAKLFEVNIWEIPNPKDSRKKRLQMDVIKNKNVQDWLLLEDGCYLLRTNVKEKQVSQLWHTYTGLVEVEDMFRQMKSPLQIRPIYHHRSDRTQAHIMICFLALVMRRVLSHWMSACGLGTAVQKLIDEVKEIRSMDVVLKAKSSTELRLRVVGTPDERTRTLLHHLKLRIPNRPKIISNLPEM